MKKYPHITNMYELIRLVTDFLKKEKIDYVITGAFALHSYGYSRMTKDVDFVIDLKNQDKIITYLKSLQFQTLNHTEGFSNHLHITEAARIDVVYIQNETSEQIFGSAIKKMVSENFELSFVSPEHLIAMKLHAIKNDPERKLKDLSDIYELLKRVRITPEVVKGYFKKYKLEKLYEEISR